MYFIYIKIYNFQRFLLHSLSRTPLGTVQQGSARWNGMPDHASPCLSTGTTEFSPLRAPCLMLTPPGHATRARPVQPLHCILTPPAPAPERNAVRSPGQGGRSSHAVTGMVFGVCRAVSKGGGMPCGSSLPKRRSEPLVDFLFTEAAERAGSLS